MLSKPITDMTDRELQWAHEALYTLAIARYDDVHEILTRMMNTPDGEIYSREYQSLKVRYAEARQRATEEYARFRAVATELGVRAARAIMAESE